jgi:hypothetical protein
MTDRRDKKGEKLDLLCSAGSDQLLHFQLPLPVVVSDFGEVRIFIALFGVIEASVEPVGTDWS